MVRWYAATAFSLSALALGCGLRHRRRIDYELREEKERERAYFEQIKRTFNAIRAARGHTVARASLSLPKDGKPAKLVHFVRHGQGIHNLYAANCEKQGQRCRCMSHNDHTNCPYTEEWLRDPALTDLGKQQAEALQQQTKLMEQTKAVEVVLVSPMRRTLETAVLAFGGRSNGSAHFEPMVACEACREAREMVPIHICDHRGAIDPSDWPGVAFDGLPGLDDTPMPMPTTQPDGTTQSGYDQLAERCVHFVEQLQALPEGKIGVVTHSGFLFALFNAVMECDDPMLESSFHTGELRSVHLTFT
jgi:broad specificity phosphatase PhoE